MNDVKRYGHISYLVDATPQILQLYPSMTVYVMASDYDELKAENESLRRAVEFSVEWFGKITSSDGSGHADLGRAVSRIAGAAISSPENP